MTDHQINIPDTALDAFQDVAVTKQREMSLDYRKAGLLASTTVQAGLAAMFAAMAPEELRELASSLLTMANGLERETPELSAPDRGQVSDGCHTFDELYAHRRALTAALTALLPGWSWRSRAHHPDDTEIFPGYFIVGISLPNGVITYHYRDQYWNDFPRARELAHAPKWDGAEPGITVSRLIDMARS